MVSNRENCSSRKAWLRVAAAIPAAFAGFGLNIACAADLPIYAPPAPAGVNWDGIYVGLNRGIAEGRADWSNPTGFFALFPPDVPGSGAHEGLFGGVQLGYNRQFGAIVLGVEGDVSFGPLDSYTNCGATFGFGGSGDPCHARTDLMASITGRAGYAVGRALLYGKAGGAFAEEHYDVISPFLDPAFPATASAGRFGWAAGAGIEYDLGFAFGGDWSARAEYDYYNFGTRTIGFNIPAIPTFNSFSIARDENLAKFGLNYRFAGAGNDYAAPAPQYVNDFSGEFGGRLGGSGGQFQKNLFDPFIPQQLNSRLTWAGQPGLLLENFARVDHISGFFAKGYAGGADLFTGHINDEDFPPGTFPYSNTISSTKDGRDFYYSAEIGYSFIRNTGWRLDGFAGYQYYSQRMNAFGCTQIASQPFVCPPGLPRA